MFNRRHIPFLLAGLASLGADGVRAQDNPWRTTPRTPPAMSSGDEERGFTQGYLRGFEQGYRRGAEQATGGAPTANLGGRTAPGAPSSVRRDFSSPAAEHGVARAADTAAPPPGPAPLSGGYPGTGARPFGEYPPLDGDRPAAQPAPRNDAAPRVAGPGYPYSGQIPNASPASPQPGHVATPYVSPYAAPYGHYGYGTPLSGPSTLNGPYGGFAGPFGAGPIPGIPYFGGW